MTVHRRLAVNRRRFNYYTQSCPEQQTVKEHSLMRVAFQWLGESGVVVPSCDGRDGLLKVKAFVAVYSPPHSILKHTNSTTRYYITGLHHKTGGLLRLYVSTVRPLPPLLTTADLPRWYPYESGMISAWLATCPKALRELWCGFQ
ncbi:hypothetical protein NDU88_006675 [Pleurodeles waltl]|uniref:Uncharacterized protein n=1 Tax=Pleurodeles waltl TaxID=8319 RepID=A0AAV7WEP8_PLEWA|nr:hypothetical protein NDU88_006675 [Pleurodeles waltl]